MALVHRNILPEEAQSNGYTATHYVAPWASVSGATSDEDVTNGTPFASATSPGTPCTLAEAMANASAGNKVQVAPGEYVGSDTDNRFDACFRPANNGIFSNPIIFFAQYPAAYNRGTPSNLSELRRTVNTPGTNTGPVLGSRYGVGGSVVIGSPELLASQYVIFDGFYIDEAETRSAPSGGTVNPSYSNGYELRRFWFDRDGVTDYNTWAGGPGYNGNCVWSQVTNGLKISDCYFGGTSTLTNQNDSCVEFYNATDAVYEYNTHINCGLGTFAKTEAPASQIGDTWYQQNVTIRYNWYDGCYMGIQSQTSRSTHIYQNVIIDTNDWTFRWDNTAANNQIDCLVNFYNNTIYTDAQNIGAIYFRGGAMLISGGEFRDNIVYFHGAGTQTFWTRDSGPGVGYDDIDALDAWNNNVWYAEGTYRWQLNGNQASLAAWQTEMAGFGVDNTGFSFAANDIFSDPEFTNAASDDFTLANNGQSARSASTTGGFCGAYITGSEEIGVRANPTY